MANRNINDGTRGHDVNRNFDKEATELLVGLSERQLYDLFQIAHSQSQKSCSEERGKELSAVKKAIRQSKGIQKYRLERIMNGYGSEMARTGNPKDGQFTPHRKKV
tara:strand:- start:230 stop:547 length:318 start_codon:yes stop_codon:yes gene_type:complete